MKKILLYLGFPLMLFANAFQSTLEDEISYLQEETFVVSASKIKENIKKTPASITVIDEEMIRNMGANNIFDILRSVPGLGVSQSNIYVDKITVRGIQTWFSEKVLILLDGHSLNIDVLNGGATGTYKDLPIELIKRIEIIKGPASALYGEGAFSALINIITKTPKDIDGTEVVLKYGSDNTKVANLAFAKEYKNFEFTSNLNYITSDGNERYIESDALGKSGNVTPTLESSNGYISMKHKNGLYFKGNYNVTKDGSKYGATYILSDDDFSKKTTYFMELGFKSSLNKYLELSLRAYYDEFKANNLWLVASDMLVDVGYETNKYGSEALLTFKNENYTVVTGLIHEHQSLSNPWQTMNDTSIASFIDEVDRKFIAIYSELLYDITKEVRFNFGLRYDYYDDFGGTLNPRTGLSYSLNTNNTFKIMFGEAFRAPTFSELYNKNNTALQGNPNLNPERLKTLEISFQNTTLENLKASITLFKTKIEDIIMLNDTVYANEGEVVTRGVELEFKYTLTRGSYFLANYTFQRPENKVSGDDLENISNHEAYMGLNYRINRTLNLYADAKYIGQQTRSVTDTRDELGSSITSNVTLLVKESVLKNLEFKLSIYNLFDEKSYDSSSPYDYPLAGRTYMTQLGYKF